jgi:hypothetical protein
MGAVLPGCVSLTDEPEVCLVDESGWLERVVGSLGRHHVGGASTKLLVNERKQLTGGAWIAPSRSVEKTGEVIGGLGHRHSP